MLTDVLFGARKREYNEFERKLLSYHNKQATTHNKTHGHVCVCVCVCVCLIVRFIVTGEIVDHHCLVVLFIMELEILLTCDIHLYSFPRRSVIDSKLGTIRRV